MGPACKRARHYATITHLNTKVKLIKLTLNNKTIVYFIKRYHLAPTIFIIMSRYRWYRSKAEIRARKTRQKVIINDTVEASVEEQGASSGLIRFRSVLHPALWSRRCHQDL